MSAVIETFNTHAMPDKAIRKLGPGQEQAAISCNSGRLGSVSLPEHAAIFGSRGFGKSCMTRLIQIWVQQRAEADQSAHYQPLPEAQRNLVCGDVMIRGFGMVQRPRSDPRRERAVGGLGGARYGQCAISASADICASGYSYHVDVRP